MTPEIWIALACYAMCSVDLARESEWRLDAIDRRHWSEFEDDALKPLNGVAFASQRACLRAIRRAEPERRYEQHDPQMGFRIVTSITHEPDYVRIWNFTNFTQEYAYACFRTPAPLS